MMAIGRRKRALFAGVPGELGQVKKRVVGGESASEGGKILPWGLSGLNLEDDGRKAARVWAVRPRVRLQGGWALSGRYLQGICTVFPCQGDGRVGQLLQGADKTMRL